MSSSDEVTKKSRTLVLCFDGTSNEYDGDNTNVVKLFALLKKDDFNEQLCYYQAGIGTFFGPGVVSPIFEWAAKILDYALAWYLDAHVMNGYKFIMQNYRAGDKICLFGFSRGAYAARALAGMLYKVGLLPRDNLEQINFAYKLYKREDAEGVRLARGFKKTYSHDVRIEFAGFWDTVSSVGLVMGRSLPFTNSNTSIKTFRHALSLDENRARFRPNVYHRSAPSFLGAALDPEQASFPLTPNKPSPSAETRGRKPLPGSVKAPGLMRRVFRRMVSLSEADQSTLAGTLAEGPPTDVLEVWFAGGHTDVGGGSVLDTEPHSLANVSLRWMLRQIIESGCGILFNEAALVGLTAPVVLVPNPDGQPAPESPHVKLDEVDALEPMHDALKEMPLWWILEILPTVYSFQDINNVWHTRFAWNLGRGREIQDTKPAFHASVKTRMEKLKYHPKAKWNQGSERYVQ